MDIYNTVAVSDNFDIIIEDNGFIKMNNNSDAVADRLKFEMSSNDSWELDLTLGLNWVDENGNGLLQYKNNEPAIVSALEKKLSTINGVKEIREITLTPIGDRNLAIYVTVVTELDDIIKIKSEV